MYTRFITKVKTPRNYLKRPFSISFSFSFAGWRVHQSDENPPRTRLRARRDPPRDDGRRDRDRVHRRMRQHL